MQIVTVQEDAPTGKGSLELALQVSCLHRSLRFVVTDECGVRFLRFVSQVLDPSVVPLLVVRPVLCLAARAPASAGAEHCSLSCYMCLFGNLGHEVRIEEIRKRKGGCICM